MTDTARMRLTAAGDGRSAYRDQPVTFGVPLPEGALKREDLHAVSVTDGEGNACPVRTHCTATWKNDLAHVKWLLADTRVSLAEDETEKTLFLDLEGAKAGGAGPRVTVQEVGDSLQVDTGAMQVRLRREFPLTHGYCGRPGCDPLSFSPDFFKSCRLKTAEGWREMLKGDHGIHLYMKDANGVVYDSCTRGLCPRVIVEEQNDLRCCVKVDGLHHTLDGRAFCPYVLRLHFYAGKADIKVFHTFVFNQDPESVALSAVGIRIPVDLGAGVRASFAGSEGPHAFDDWRELCFTQTGHKAYAVERDGREVARGTRGLCRAAMLGERGGLAAVFRDGWQEYPFGFRLAPGCMEVEVWPEANGEPLRFTTPFREPAIVEFAFDPHKVVPGEEEEFVRIINERPRAPISVRAMTPHSLEKIAWVEAMLEKHARGRVIGYNDMHMNNGAGAAKTSEIHLRFNAETLFEDDLDALAVSVQEPVVVLANASGVCASGAFGPFHHAGDPLFARVDANLDRVTYEVGFEPDALCEHYGKMRYGNLPGTHSAACHWAYCYYRKTDPLKAARYMGPFNNEANDEIFAFWGGFIRTGRRDYFLRAQKFSRCVADVSTIHAHPEKPENVGGMHGHSSHCWTGHPTLSHTLVAGYLTDYYFTGNRRLLDVAEEAAERIFNFHPERIGIVAYRGDYLLREYTGAISVLLEAYQATWKEKYRWLAERSLDILLTSRNGEAFLPNAIRTAGFLGNEILVQPPAYPEVAWGNRYLVFESALRLFGASPALEKLIIDEADYYTWECPIAMTQFPVPVCYAYQLTGDLHYAAFAKWFIEDHFDAFMEQRDEEGAMAPGDDRVNGYVPKLMWMVRDAADRAPGAFEGACREWRARRAATPGRPELGRPDAAPFKSLGILTPGLLPRRAGHGTPVRERHPPGFLGRDQAARHARLREGEPLRRADCGEVAERNVCEDRDMKGGSS